MKKLILIFVSIILIFNFTACGKNNVATPRAQGTIADKIKNAVSSSPKDLIIGSWVLVDNLENGESTFTEDQKKQIDTNPNNQIIYVFEKDKVKFFYWGSWIEVSYKWIDDKTIETTQVLQNGTTEAHKSTVDVTNDKLTMKGDPTNESDKNKECVLRRFKGELPKETSKDKAQN